MWCVRDARACGVGGVVRLALLNTWAQRGHQRGGRMSDGRRERTTATTGKKEGKRRRAPQPAQPLHTPRTLRTVYGGPSQAMCRCCVRNARVGGFFFVRKSSFLSDHAQECLSFVRSLINIFIIFLFSFFFKFFEFCLFFLFFFDVFYLLFFITGDHASKQSAAHHCDKKDNA